MNNTNKALSFAAIIEQLDFQLKHKDLAGIEKTFSTTDAAVILSADKLALVRAIGKSDLALFLASLAADNGIDQLTAALWRDTYQSIRSGILVGKLTKTDKRHPLRQTLELIISGNPGDQAIFDKSVGTDQDLVNAFEIACDSSRWDLAVSLLSSKAKSTKNLRVCLLMAQAILKRQPRQKQKDVNAAIADLYKKILNLTKSTDLTDIKNNLMLARGTALQASGEFQAAIDTYAAIDPERKEIAVQFESGKTQCKSGDTEGAIERLDGIILLLLDKNSRQNPDAPPPLIFQNSTEANFSVERASAAIRDLALIAKMASQKLFIVSGTLLGYARTGNLLAHDKDVDMGLIGHAGLPRLVQTIIDSKLFYLSPDYLKGTNTIQVPVIHVLTGVWIDLFIYTEQEDALVTGVDFQFGYRQKFRFKPFDLQPIEFLGTALHAPSDIDRNLTENFGDWRKPDPSYISHLESPSTMDKGGLVHLLTGRVWIIKAIQEGNPLKFRKALDTLLAYPNKPGALPARIVAALEKYRETHLSEKIASADSSQSAPDEIAAH